MERAKTGDRDDSLIPISEGGSVLLMMPFLLLPQLTAPMLIPRTTRGCFPTAKEVSRSPREELARKVSCVCFGSATAYMIIVLGGEVVLYMTQ